MEREERPEENMPQAHEGREPEPVASSWTGPAPEIAAEESPGPQAHPDYYGALGVPRGSGRRAIAEAYDRLSQELQPDTNAPPTDPEQMRRIDEAFDFLDDPVRRAEYNRSLGIESLPDVRRGPFADRGMLLALALIFSGVAALIAAAVVLFVDLTGDDEEDGPLITTESGLEYQDLKVGDGERPQPGDQVTVHYLVMLEDGTVIDDSYTDNSPLTFAIGRAEVIEGWDEGISSMREGGRRRLIIPPDLAYGEQGFGDVIPPNATLISEVDLLAVDPASSPTPTLPTQSPTTAPEAPPEMSGEEITTASGLKYIDIEVGDGEEAVAGDTVVVNYTGWLADAGTKFDSSLERSTPFSFTLGAGDVIAGWDEGILNMKVGGKRRLIIPPDLGYGEQGRAPVIPANATLIFDVELIEVR